MNYVLIGLLVVLIFGSGFLSASETGMFSLSLMRLRAYRSSSDVRSQQIAKLLAEPRKLLVTILMLNILMNILVQNVVASLFGNLASYWLNVGVPLVLILFFGEIIPKSFAYAKNTAVARFVAPFYIYIERVIGPTRDAIQRMTSWLSRMMFFFLSTEQGASVEELKMVLRQSKEQDVLGSEEAKLVRGYLNLEEDRVKEIMRPRAEMVTYDIQTSVEKLIAHFVDEELTRIPVTDGDQENIIGVIEAGDVLIHRAKIKEGKDIKTYLHEPFFVPESMSGKLLLKQMYERGKSLAICVDEYGALAGLITSEDLIELVFGQIVDRRDAGSHFTRATEDIIIASGKLELIEFEEIFDVHLDSQHNMATVGGWLTEQVEDLPKAGDKITLSGFLFHVLEADDRHVKRLYIRRIKPRRKR
ncbi:MAG: HlyC/CorC family transporter [Chlamydiales bacterium]|nr:HlyC/CorC family transporter [Chlamydiales bacterium]